MAIGLRAPGLQWLLAVAPYSGFDFHPDVMRLIRPTDNFSQIKSWSGYPLGMTTQLYLLRKGLGVLGYDVDPVLLIRGISLGYGVMTVFLAGVVSRALSGSSRVGLLAALFLALAPLHIINSHFGTADSTLVFFLYVSFVFGWRSLQNELDLDFVLFVAAVGVTLAIKFFIPLLLPLAIVVWHQQRRLEKALQAALLLAGSFSVASFFNYTPWDLSQLLGMIRDDNLTSAGGLTPLGQLGWYVWETTRALGLAVWLLFVVGLVLALARGFQHRSKRLRFDPAALYDSTKSPYIVPLSALSLHFVSLLAAQYHGARHLLPFLPLMCFVAAMGLSRIPSRRGFTKTAASGMLLVIVAYQVYNAVGVEAGYAYDIRHALATRISEVAAPTDEVVSFSQYSLVRGARLASDSEAAASRISSAFFVTCSLEYQRYNASDDAADVYHPRGGQSRLDFYRDLFADRLDYRLVAEFSREDFTLEQRLATRRLLPGLGLMTPRRCLLFART